MNENRPDVPLSPAGSRLASAGMAHRLDDRVILQALCDVEAEAWCARMRIGSVRKPRISSQASNGDSLPPR